jgi:hypothetical protein
MTCASHDPWHVERRLPSSLASSLSREDRRRTVLGPFLLARCEHPVSGYPRLKPHRSRLTDALMTAIDLNTKRRHASADIAHRERNG